MRFINYCFIKLKSILVLFKADCRASPFGFHAIFRLTGQNPEMEICPKAKISTRLFLPEEGHMDFLEAVHFFQIKFFRVDA